MAQEILHLCDWIYGHVISDRWISLESCTLRMMALEEGIGVITVVFWGVVITKKIMSWGWRPNNLHFMLGLGFMIFKSEVVSRLLESPFHICYAEVGHLSWYGCQDDPHGRYFYCILSRNLFPRDFTYLSRWEIVIEGLWTKIFTLEKSLISSYSTALSLLAAIVNYYSM